MVADSKESFPFHYTLRVRYADADYQGIVFNGNYLTYFDVAITEYIRHFSMPFAAFVKEYDLDFHVIQAELDFKAPARPDEDIDIYVKGYYNGPKLFWDLAIFKADTFLCSGKLIYVGVDKVTGKIKKIPTSVVETLRLNPLLNPQSKP